MMALLLLKDVGAGQQIAEEGLLQRPPDIGHADHDADSSCGNPPVIDLPRADQHLQLGNKAGEARHSYRGDSGNDKGPRGKG